MRVLILLCFTALIAPTLAYSAWMNEQMMRADPDGLLNPELLSYALRAGRQPFLAHCATCHEADARGDSERGIPNLTDADWLYGSGEVSEIERIVAYGIRSDNPKSWNLAIMPAYASLHPSPSNSNITPLAPAQIRDVIEFLLFLQGQARSSDAVARGGAVFGNIGDCYDCHGIDGRGDPAIGAPNLTDKITLYGRGTPNGLLQSIMEGRHGVCPAWAGRMTPGEMRATAFYVHSLSPRVAPVASIPLTEAATPHG